MGTAPLDGEAAEDAPRLASSAGTPDTGRPGRSAPTKRMPSRYFLSAAGLAQIARRTAGAGRPQPGEQPAVQADQVVADRPCLPAR